MEDMEPHGVQQNPDHAVAVKGIQDIRPPRKESIDMREITLHQEFHSGKEVGVVPVADGVRMRPVVIHHCGNICGGPAGVVNQGVE